MLIFANNDHVHGTWILRFLLWKHSCHLPFWELWKMSGSVLFCLCSTTPSSHPCYSWFLGCLNSTHLVGMSAPWNQKVPRKLRVVRTTGSFIGCTSHSVVAVMGQLCFQGEVLLSGDLGWPQRIWVVGRYLPVLFGAGGQSLNHILKC